MTRAHELYHEFRHLRALARADEKAGLHGQARLFRDIADRVAVHYLRECARTDRPAFRIGGNPAPDNWVRRLVLG